MNKKLSMVLGLFLCCILLVVTFSGCIENEQKSEEKALSVPEIKLDEPSILPDWKDGEYHDYYGTIDLLNEFQIKYPDLVNIFSIGKSVLDRDIWCIRLTDEKCNNVKLSCLIDGTIHGCEWEAGDACLYLAEYLLINFHINETITNILNTTEIYIIPLLNPDGRQIDDRFNANGIDLNRNFDVDFGRLRGGCLRIGTLLGKRVFSYRAFPLLHKVIPSFPQYLINCGRKPFSEPESRTLHDFAYELKDSGLSFYLNCHTAVHNIGTPWQAFKPPFRISDEENKIYEYVRKWVDENTEYEDSEMNYLGDVYKSSGTSVDWIFKEFRIPAFVFEVLNPDFEPGAGGGRHEYLVHWMKTTLPVFMYMLVNIENLHSWVTPDIQPTLPEGIPPLPLK